MVIFMYVWKIKLIYPNGLKINHLYFSKNEQKHILQESNNKN